eukprot:6175947-Pleurochrysis_carterae.AAC.2
MPLLVFYNEVQKKAAIRWKGWKPTSRFIRLQRPYRVRDATREVCLCRYYLQWETYATAFYRFVRKLDCKCDKCSQAAHVRSGVLLRRLQTCERENEFDLVRRPCVYNKCK